MPPCKYTGKRGTVYFIDEYVKGKRYREKVGPKKKQAEEYRGKRLMEIMGHSDHRMMRRDAHLTPEHKRAAISRLPNWSVTGSKIHPVER
jgi:hypothetical protein